MRISITLLGMVITVMINTGCSSTGTGGCHPNAAKYGYFCFHGKNFGKHRSSLYKRGVRDGCITGEGHFRKNYYYSSRYKDYLDGWIAGRRVCRPDTAPKYSTATPNQSVREYHRRYKKRRYKKEYPTYSEIVYDDIETLSL